MNRLAEAMIAGVNWDDLRAGPGTAADVPAAFADLAQAESDDEAKRCYWRLDNVVVVQGMLHESALPAIPVIYSLLAGPLSPAARYRLVELLVEIAGGEAAQAEDDIGNGVLTERCREALSQGLWSLYGLLLNDDPRVRLDGITLLGWVEGDTNELLAALRMAVDDDDEKVRAAASKLLAEVS